MIGRVPVTLYRRTLRIIERVRRCNGEKIALSRWAEYLPAGMVIHPEDTLSSIARRCFEEPNSNAGLTTAFSFIREASTACLPIELEAQWRDVSSRGVYDMYECIGLISGALQVASIKTPPPGTLQSHAKDYSTFLRCLVGGVVQRTRKRVSIDKLDTGNQFSVNSLHQVILEEASLARRDALPEDYTAISLAMEKKAAEYLLNIVLLLILQELGVNGCLVGVDLVFRWVRVSNPHGPPLFLSWSYGALSRKEVETLIRSANSQWFRATEWDAPHRKGVLRALLKKELACMPTDVSEDSARVMSLCKEQILHLLS